MKPVEFEGQNLVLAKDQPQYLPLPVYLDNTKDGIATSCWKLSFKEIVRIAFTGRIWISVMTFRSPMMPILLSTDKPEMGGRER